MLPESSDMKLLHELLIYKKLANLIKINFAITRGGSRATASTKIERFVMIVNG